MPLREGSQGDGAVVGLAGDMARAGWRSTAHWSRVLSRELRTQGWVLWAKG